MLNVTPVSNNLTSPQRRTKKVGIIYNDVKPVACQVTQELKVRLEAYGCQVATATGLGGLLGYANANKPAKFIPIESLVPKDFDDAMDFAIVLGGDGTVLSAFRQVAPAGIPLLAVNTGHMGFLTETYLNQLPHVLEQVLAGNYQVEDRTMVAVQLVPACAILRSPLVAMRRLILPLMASSFPRQPGLPPIHFQPVAR